MTQPHLGKSAPLVPPLFQSSVYCLPDLDTLDQIMNAESPGFIYARDGHPNARQLAAEITTLHAASWTVVCASGMAAISAMLLTALKQGDRLIASNRLYGKTTQLLAVELARFGVQTTFIDSCDLDQVRAAFEKPAQLLFVETLSNPLLRMVDTSALAEIAHQHGCLLIVDNTFATPALFRPLELGADLVMESLTKMIGGHSDVTLGSVSGRSEMGTSMAPLVSTWGLVANPFDCWLTLRSLPTLSLRMRQASANALALARWLPGQPGVARVIYPGLPDHPDHALAARYLQGAFGSMLCFELSGGREAVNQFMRRAPGIPFSPSLGDTSTTLSHPGTTSHRYVSPVEKSRQGISDGLIRLSVGVEDLEQIEREIGMGLAAN